MELFKFLCLMLFLFILIILVTIGIFYVVFRFRNDENNSFAEFWNCQRFDYYFSVYIGIAVSFFTLFSLHVIMVCNALPSYTIKVI